MHSLVRYIYIRVSKKLLFPERVVEKFHDKLEWWRVCSSPDPAILKNLFADFRKFYYTTFLLNLHDFPYFDPTKNSTKFFFISFAGIPYWLRSIKKNLRICTMYFLVLVLRHCWRVGLMKPKIVEVKSFYNYLTHQIGTTFAVMSPSMALK